MADPTRCWHRATQPADDGLIYPAEVTGCTAPRLACYAAQPIPPETITRTLTDHLYPDCPTLARHQHTPMRMLGDVCPDGTDLCGMCVARWRRTGNVPDQLSTGVAS